MINRLNTEVVKILRNAEVQQRLLAQGAEPVGGSSKEFRDFQLSEMSRWEKVIKTAKIRLD